MKNTAIDVVRAGMAGLLVLAAGWAHAGDPAQSAEAPPPPLMHFQMAGDGPMDHIMIMRAEETFEARLVKGAPYQAEAVHEFVQTLADGNRIVRRSTSTVARDGDGRTRREQGLAAIGPVLAGGPEGRTVFINDPVAGVSWILESDQKVARKITRSGGDVFFRKEPGERVVVTKKDGKTAVQSERIVIRHGGPGGPGGGQTFTRALPKPESESLGTRTVEGVEATGTRSTVTIPAGEMGNEKPIAIVTERWYSPELQTVVMTRHSDPRMGETTFRLTQLTRGEPDRSLFEVPADYTVKEGGPGREIHLQHRELKPSDDKRDQK